MPRVLIVSPADLTPELGQTVLWRSDIERSFVATGEEALRAIREQTPGLVILEGNEASETSQFVAAVRALPETRQVSVAVLSRSASRADEEAFRRAGANLVLAGDVNPMLWDDRLEELLDVPPRREVRIPVRLEVWSHFAPDNEHLSATALNISARGLLLETDETLAKGTTLELAFALPGGHALKAVAQVVREAEIVAGRPRYGVEFLILKREARSRIEDFVATRV
jgi:CheY-like chemotaxis protein